LVGIFALGIFAILPLAIAHAERAGAEVLHVLDGGR
jgi:hypothetical protein